MLSQFVWWGGIALEIFLLTRGLREKLVSRYPVFYTYVAFILAQDLFRFVIYGWYRDSYRDIYWFTEFVALILGCGVVFEIYRVGLSAYPGAARMARNALGLVFACALAKGIVQATSDRRWWMEAATTDIEAALRTVEALALIFLAGLFLFYSVPFGKNLRGIVLGHGLFVSISAIGLTFVSSSTDQTREWLSAVYRISYLAVLGVWLVHLWSYQRSPAPVETARIEEDYQRLAAASHRRLQEARGYLAKAVRS
jgi:hypothetical protein